MKQGEHQEARWKTVWFCFQPMDFKAAEAYLNEMAAKGWELYQVGRFLADFQWTQRTDLKYCVEIAGGRKRAYLDLCEEAGWELVEGGCGVNVFKSRPGENPAPLQTDGELERERFRKHYLRWELLSLLLLCIVVFYPQLYLQSHHIRWYDLLSGMPHQLYLLLVLAWVVVWIGYEVRLFRYWRRSEREGYLPRTPFGRARVWSALVVLVPALVIAAGFLAPMLSMRSVPPDSVPVVRAEDLNPACPEAAVLTCEHGASPILSQDRYFYASSGGRFLCDRFETAWPGLADRVAESLVREEQESPAQNYDHRYHGALALEPVELGFDRAWLGRIDETRQCLILVQGRTTVRVEAPVDFTAPAVRAVIRARLGLVEGHND